MEPGLVPLADLALAAAVAAVALLALALRRRGGRFRALPGWATFWLFFAGILLALSHAHRWLSLTLLGVLMFAALRTYFFLAPVRPRDRSSIAAAYLAIPFALYPGLTGSVETFLATVPVVLFLLFPVLLSIGPAQQGLLDSMGRILLGVLLFVFCAAHLGLLPAQHGRLELFGVLVIAAELPQRLAGRYQSGSGWLKPTLGLAAGGLLALSAGYALGQEDAARAALLVWLAVSAGGFVSDGVARDLGLGPADVYVGRAAFLDRTIPPVYAAPLFFYYLYFFA
jgi:predicted CDP-diglyceride synthetase/phosphatidate cytidylyltransferase